MSLPGGPWPPSADPHLLPVQTQLEISVPDVLCLHRQGQVREDTQTLAVSHLGNLPSRRLYYLTRVLHWSEQERETFQNNSMDFILLTSHLFKAVFSFSHCYRKHKLLWIRRNEIEYAEKTDVMNLTKV